MKKCLLATASVAAATIACSGMARAGDVAQSHTYIQLFGGYAISSGQSS